MNTYLYRASNLKSTITSLSSILWRKPIFWCRLKQSFLAIYFYVGLARAVSPTNTNFQFTFLLTRLQEALYDYLPV